VKERKKKQKISVTVASHLMAATDVPHTGIISVSHTQTTVPYTTTAAHINFLHNSKLTIYRNQDKT